jgi:CBS domain-containing protein
MTLAVDGAWRLKMTVEPLRVRDYLTTDVLAIGADVEIMRAIHMLVEQDISGIPVVDDRSRVIGILTERDCIRTALQAGYFDEAGGLVADYMSSPVHTVSPDDSLMDLAELFATSPFRRCPVVEDGRLVGLICRRDVLRALKGRAWFSG